MEFPVVTAKQLVETQPMFRPDYGGAVLTKELLLESYERMKACDSVVRVVIWGKNGRSYQIHPAGRLRRAWNWVRGYRPRKP